VARYLIAATVIASSLLIGCGPRSETSPSDGETATQEPLYRIAVIPMATTDVFWTSVHAGALHAAEELGNVEIYWEGPLTMNDREGQINIVQNYVAQEVDGIVLAPIDRTALVRYVADAQMSGIAVVVIDSALDDESTTVSFVATDNYHGGQLGARTLAKFMNNKGDAILLRYTVGQESGAQREQGFLDTVAKEFPDINMLSDNQYSGPTEVDAYNKSMDLLNQFGDRVDGIFVICNRTATGVLQALEEEELVEKVKLIGFDRTSHLVKALEDGKLGALVVQDPVNIGYLGVKTMVAHLRGEKVEKRIYTGEYVATKENLDDPKINLLLHPQKGD
jgi:ribose transport system substrate-binding protein